MGKKVKCILNNEDNYISFSREVGVDSFVKGGKKFWLRDLWFIDSFRFMHSSLDALSKNLGEMDTVKSCSFYIKRSMCPLCCWTTHSSRRRH